MDQTPLTALHFYQKEVPLFPFKLCSASSYMSGQVHQKRVKCWKRYKVTNKVLGAIIFFRIGGHEKAGGGHRIFFTRNRMVTKNQEIIGWLQILMKILFNEIAPKCIFSALRAFGVTYFFNIVTSGGGGGHNIFDHQIGGSQKYCRGTFGNLWPPYSKENGSLLKCWMKRVSNAEKGLK